MSEVPSWFTRELWPGDSGRDVLIVQRKLGCELTGVIDKPTEARIMGAKKKSGAKPTPNVDADLAKKLGERPTKNLQPDWFHRDLELWSEGEDVRALRSILGLDDSDDRFTVDVELEVRRLQSQNKMRPSGRVDLDTAKILGDK